ncbi:MAG: ABC transporter substrate-binding protein [Candidatus Bipolaricaulaceae bacterium]
MIKFSLVVMLLSVVWGSALGTELIVAVSTEPPSLDPTTNAAAAIDLLLHHNLYENLVQVDAHGELHGQLAESWELSLDGLTYTFHLRDGIRFHDGQAGDARAVKESFLRLLDPATGVPHPEYFRNLVAVETVDRLTVRLVLDEAQPAFLPTLALGDAVVVAPGADLASRPVGTGPFRFRSWQPGSRLVLERNLDYYLPRAAEVDRVEFRFIPDPSAQLAALQAGDVDMVAELAPEVAAGLAGQAEFRVVSAPQNLVQIMAVNTARRPFTDVKVRQALACAVHRQEIIDLVSFGYGTPIGSHLTPALPYYADMTWVHPHDPQRARDLLAQAGLADGFTATLTLPENYPFHVRTGEVIAAQLRRVGLQVRLELVDWGTWLDRVYGQADYDLTVIGHVGRLDPALMLTGYGADRREYYFRRGWADPELERLLHLGGRPHNPEARKAIYTVCQYIIAREAVNVFLQDPHRILAMRVEVTGVEVFPIYVLDLTAARIQAG